LWVSELNVVTGAETPEKQFVTNKSKIPNLSTPEQDQFN
jgi:hypothetical protein